jgi:spermidine synthase
VFAVLYACSGAAGLIYEIVWTRLISLQLGHTVAAVGTVLAAFMGGLAAGALVAGSVAPRLSRDKALRGYAAVECAIALCAALLPFALAASKPLFSAAYGDQPGPAFALVRISSCLLLVFVPATAIGATFPLAIRWFVGEAATAGRDAGRLYALNTMGAAAGALASGFLLIPTVGVRATTWTGILLNIVAAGGAWMITKRAPAVPPARTTLSTPLTTSKTKRAAVLRDQRGRRGVAGDRRISPRWLPASVLGLAGFVALVYEVAFTRVLAIALGPTTYAFAAMLTSFITGTAIGAAIAARRAKTGRAAASGIGLLLLVVATVSSAAGWFAGTRLPLMVADAVAGGSVGPSGILAREAIYAIGVLLPLSSALGALFPLAVALVVASDDRVARDTSVVYGVNTIGAVAGSLAAAFLLVPLLGVQHTIRVAGVAAVGAACLTFIAARLATWHRVVGGAAAIAAGGLLFAVPRWDLNLLSGGAYKYASEVRDLGLDLATGLRAGTLLYYKEGAAGTVSVRRLAGTLALAIDGKVDASNGPDMLTQKLLGHLPLMLHPHPLRVAIVGLGSGVTLGATLAHPIERTDVLEISPEVVEASSFFASDNGRALDDGRTHLLVTDGRTHLQLTSRRYDVIISEPSNPWMAGVASLFTREFFEAARGRLAPGGVVCQWAHTYDISEADLRSIAATFVSVFPKATMWLIGEGDLLLIATNDTAPPTLENLAGAWRRPQAAADLAAASVVDPFSVLSLYAGGPEEVRRYAHGAVIQTDDLPMLEFSAPLGVYLPRDNANAAALEALLDPAQAPAAVRTAFASAAAAEWRNRGQMFLKAHAYARAYDSFSRSVQLNANDEATLAGLVEAASAGQRLAEAQQLLESLSNRPRADSNVRVALARLLAALGSYEQAIKRAQQVMASEPSTRRGMELLASILADAGDVARLGPLVGRMQQAYPDRQETAYYAAMLDFLNGDFPDAIALAERVVQMNPRHALALNLIGSANANLGRVDRARQAFRASLEASPQDPSTYANLGMIEMESGNRDAAVAYFAESLTLDPHHEAARTNLSALLATASQRP